MTDATVSVSWQALVSLQPPPVELKKSASKGSTAPKRKKGKALRSVVRVGMCFEGLVLGLVCRPLSTR